MTPFAFHTEERLKSHQIIGSLFQEGLSFSIYPLRVIWRPLTEPNGSFPAQFALTVPRRAFKRAVDRNQLRRRIREAYRLHKPHFYRQLPADQDQQLALMVIYTAREALPYAVIERSMKRLLKRLARQVAKS
ncbi:MAG: ribonuclease P protein component [Bacteroidota bacterium]